MRSLADRLWPKVQKTENCWLWTGAKHRNGYGVIGLGGKRAGIGRVHRVVFEMTHGPIPDGYHVCHHCDVRHCVRPEHLFLGSRQDNMDDAVAKRRMASGDRHGMRTHPERRSRGEAHGMAKLDASAVIAIRKRYTAGGVSQSALAAEFGVQQMSISRIVRNVCWSHV